MGSIPGFLEWTYINHGNFIDKYGMIGFPDQNIYLDKKYLMYEFVYRFHNLDRRHKPFS